MNPKNSNIINNFRGFKNMKKFFLLGDLLEIFISQRFREMTERKASLIDEKFRSQEIMRFFSNYTCINSLKLIFSEHCRSFNFLVSLKNLVRVKHTQLKFCSAFYF